MATIFCFTSTGNSLYTAERIAEKIGGKVLSMGENPMECEDDVIGFVFPVYFWGLPRRVERFIAKLRIVNKGAYVFAVATCGGPIFGVLGRLKKRLKTRDILLRYGASLISVTNYLPEYKANDSEALRQKIDERILKITDAIKSRKSNRFMPFTLPNKLIYNTYPNESSDQYFTIAPACTGCATCQRVCPAENIAMENSKPAFQHRCEHCLACLHNCPAHAIDWKQKTQGKERYRNAEVALEDLISFNRAEDIRTMEGSTTLNA